MNSAHYHERVYPWASDLPPLPVKLNCRTESTPFGRELLAEVLDPRGARIMGVNGGIGCSKSYSIAQVVKVVAMTRPGVDVLITGSSLPFLTSVMKKRCEEVFGGAAVWNGGMVLPHFCFPNGSKVFFRAYQCHATRAESSNSLEGNDYHLTVVDEVEQLPQTIITHTLERTRISARDGHGTLYDPTVIWIGRPGVVDFWITQTARFMEQGMNAKILQPRTWDNPTLWEYDQNGRPRSIYLERLRKKMSEQEFNCKTGHVPGTEMPMDGAIYGEFIPALYPAGNLLKWTYDGRPCQATVDFGRAYPAVAFVTQVEVDGELRDVVFDELQPDDCLTPLLMRKIKQRGHNIVEVVCDPAGKTPNGQTGVSDIQLLRESLGVPVVFTTTTDKRRIISGISRMRSLICNADKERRLLISASLWEASKSAAMDKRTIRSFLKYTWKHAEKGLTPNKGGAGQPDHIADALRYWVVRYRWRDGDDAPVSVKDVYTPAPAPRRRLGHR